MNHQQKKEVEKLAKDLWALWERLSINGAPGPGQIGFIHSEVGYTDRATAAQSAIHAAYYAVQSLVREG